MNDNKPVKALIMAGTHKREYGFSHPTADLVLNSLGLSASNPHQTYVGVDKARKALIWDVGDIAIAKIFREGPTSPEYLATLSSERIAQLKDFERKVPTSEMAETFEHDFNWTSVHNYVIESTKSTFFFDLHSYHSKTKGIENTLAYIMPHTGVRNNSIMASALYLAKAKEPQIYGADNSLRVLDAIDEKRLEIAAKQRSDLFDGFSLEQLSRINWSERKRIMGNISRRAGDFWTDYEREAITSLGNNWQLRMRNNNGPIPTTPTNPLEESFTFEAIGWGPQQQKATANFIVNYLRPIIKAFNEPKKSYN